MHSTHTDGVFPRPNPLLEEKWGGSAHACDDAMWDKCLNDEYLYTRIRGRRDINPSVSIYLPLRIHTLDPIGVSR